MIDGKASNMAIKRSPRYPRIDLSRAVSLVERLYDGAHQSKVDADSAAQVIGYTNSGSGAAAVALGALRQYGLVDGLRGDLSVSDLAMRIMQPMRDEERIEALHEAANKPEIFSSILEQFEGGLPKADAPITAFLVRQLGFSQKGASEVIGVLRDTFSNLPDMPVVQAPAMPIDSSESATTPDISVRPQEAFGSSPVPVSSELIVLPLGSGCKAELRFVGEVTPKAYERLIRHLQLLQENLDD